MQGTRSTAEMLAEISIGTAAEAVTAMRYNTNPFGPTFIPTLDERLIAARPHPGGATLQRGDLVEVVGPTGSGKTTLITFLLLTTLLPPTIIIPTQAPHSDPNPISISTGGRGSHAALLYPSSHRSLIPRLAEGMKAHLISCINPGNDGTGTIRLIPSVLREVDEVIRCSLRRLRVVKVKARYRSWALGLKSILAPPYGHLDRLSRVDGMPNKEGKSGQAGRRAVPGEVSRGGSRDIGMADVRDLYGEREGEGQDSDHGLDLVICDGFGDGFWPERWADEERASAGKKRRAGPGPGPVASTGNGVTPGLRGAEDVGMRDVMDVIGRLRKELGAVVILSVQALWSTPGTPFFSPHLPHPYPAPWTDPSTLATSSAHNFNRNQSQHPHFTNPTFWPLNIQLSLTGRIRPLQLPSDLTLIEAMQSRGLYAGTGANTSVYTYERPSGAADADAKTNVAQDQGQGLGQGQGHGQASERNGIDSGLTGGWRRRETQKFEGYVRVNMGGDPAGGASGAGDEAGGVRGAKWDWRIGEDGLEAWSGD